jgi:nicotinamidase/pyrazinamidase
MIHGGQVFVDIDTQRDFMEPDGALFITGAPSIEPNLARLTRFATSRRIPILATACAHQPDDPELRRFPPHCLVGTPGQKRISATDWPTTRTLEIDEPFTGEIPPHLTLLKRELDCFSHVGTDDLIARYSATRPIFVVYGVATDYCVLAAVEGLLARHCRVVLVVDAIRAINAEAEPAILTNLAHRGVLLTVTDVVVDLSSSLKLE